ncbi:endolytic transglycosylase MltG [Rhodococcus sp. WMMA185]|uniref:endolytic transglycosylase MltG n=1 Tax=Rhodococcus sp. WMMA185 TaxID=679318 RepID=UPI0008788962|nr:endolytic transglycosylase MltG [Rhodococcus sp. WMMA185]
MSNHRRPSGERPDHRYHSNKPRRHRYLDEDDDPVSHQPQSDDITTGRHGSVNDGWDHRDVGYRAGYEFEYGPSPTGYGRHEYDEYPDYDDSPYESGSHPGGRYDRPGSAFAEAETQVIRVIPPTRAQARLQARRRKQARGRARRGKIVGVMAVAVVLIVLGGLVFVGGRVFLGGSAPADYAGPGGPEVVVEVHPGDTAEQIGSALTAQDVVASGAAFYNAALQNEAITSLQPGFYSLSTQIPAAEAVNDLIDPASRVGQMIISEGRQLHDTTDVQTGATKHGIYSLISEASCLGDGDQRTCISYDDLNAAGAGDLTALGVPDWARASVASVPDRDRQLEGLIAAGTWNFNPTWSPTAILEHLVSQSAASYEATGILTDGIQAGLSPYEMLISASLVERESLPADFSKVARVILNRLAVNQPLQFDSTVNYELDTTELATTDADRARVTPWNTYASPGLPATPISSPSIAALEAVEQPAPGDWIYFVTVDSQGTTLFTRSYEEHLANIDEALRNGILASGR